MNKLGTGFVLLFSFIPLLREKKKKKKKREALGRVNATFNKISLCVLSIVTYKLYKIPIISILDQSSTYILSNDNLFGLIFI